MGSKAKEEERRFILEVIEMYHSLPALWNTKSKEYSNRNKKNEQYDELLGKYKEKYPNADRKQLISRLNSLRTNFRKELKKINDSKRSGAGTSDVVEPTLWYFNEIKFLIGIEKPCESQNIREIENDSQGQDIADNNYSDVPTTEGKKKEDNHPKKKQKLEDIRKEVLLLAREQLQKPDSEYDKIAAAWAVELAKMEPGQQLFAKKGVNDILFEGQLGTLHKNSIKINEICPGNSQTTPNLSVTFFPQSHTSNSS
ncbi:uncharacterized protein LOC115878839 [Sitophilus oryzae]|uniref:Uncharacterized protein LOC115878839 n=1 Tax=Sitophilus oryzae TaxID=7048 RepID=A0A6J2XIN4_SITOR|nr:uncharacterized protein LOC115878839 [Sitophilus oryzae]XP_030751323.1 uncharacterized protein LOC115878839 [Sitophilus oryzae]